MKLSGALAELRKRIDARNSLDKFTELITPDEPPPKHIRLLNSHLEAIERGELRNLMVLMPPGGAKSKSCSWMFVSWYFGKHPDHNIIAASYSGELIKTQSGRKVRNTIDSPEFQSVFDVRLAIDSQAKGEWATNKGGEYYATGVGGSITGRRGNGGIFDDPVKGRQDADSETVRQTTWEWYCADYLTRFKPDAWQVLVLTHWHEDDIAGRLLPDDWNGESGHVTCSDGKVWYILCLPAEARAGDVLGRKPKELLWPDYLGPILLEQKITQSPRNWASLYQQIPAPDEGTFFQREWFKRYDKAPADLNTYITSDYAVTDDGGDFTEHAPWGIDPKGDLWLLEGWFGQTAPDVWIDKLLDLIKRHKPLAAFGEKGVIRKSIEPFLKKRIRERGIYCRLEWIAPIGDKPARARAFQSFASQGRVHIPKTEYGERCLAQLLKFPAGKFDDFVDTSSLIGMAIDSTHPAIVAEKPETENRDVYDFDRPEALDYRTI